MFDPKTLARSLSITAGVAANKRANAFTRQDEQPVDNVKLQEIIGNPNTYPLSWMAQNHPASGDLSIANPLSPVGGDEAFFAGLLDGARMLANDGSWWDIEEYHGEGGIHIRNVWYPRIQSVVSIQELRRSIHSWIEPFLQRVPPMPVGADYGVLDTRSVN